MSVCILCFGDKKQFHATCAHVGYVCPRCGRAVCARRWRNAFATESHAKANLIIAQHQFGSDCVVYPVVSRNVIRYRIGYRDTANPDSPSLLQIYPRPR